MAEQQPNLSDVTLSPGNLSSGAVMHSLEASQVQAAATPEGQAGDTSKLKIDDVGQLQELAPALWKALIESMAQRIRSQMQASEKRIEEIMKESRRNG